MSRGHSLSKGLEARRRDLVGRGRGHWARDQRGQSVACSPVLGSLRPCVPSPKPSQSRKVERSLSPVASTASPWGYLKPWREVCGSMTIHEPTVLDVEILV